MKKASNLTDGLDGTITVYDYTGTPIKFYEGKFDIKENSSEKVEFDLNGKRYIIYNAHVIVEEK